jgi:hypothetical protein
VFTVKDLLRAAWPLALVWSLYAAAPEAAPAQQPGLAAPAARAEAEDTTERRAPAPDPVADSIIAALRKLPGYVATEYQGDTAVYRAPEGVLRLKGEAEVRREGDQLNADSIIYRNRQQLVEAYGNPKVSGGAQELEGEVLFYDLAKRSATALNARTQITESATWFVRGNVTLRGTDHIYASHGVFTTCDLEVPHYHFEADKIKVIKDKLLVARPARLYFGNVPVMVLPFVVQNLEEGRRSGFLVPRFSLTDIVRNSSGHTREISDLGWYWAINDYLGGQVSGTWRSGAYTSLLGNLDFNWKRQFLNGNFTFQRYWRTSGRREFGIGSRASWRPDERTNLALSGNYASSSEFVRESTYDPREATQDLMSSFSMSRRFDWGTLALGSDARQSMADGGISATFPSFSLSPNPITLFRQSNPDLAAWYNNVTLAWNLTGRRNLTRGRSDFARRLQDDTRTDLQGGLTQLSIGNLNFSATGSLNQTLLEEVIGADSVGNELGRLAGGRQDRADWNASVGYQQKLIGQTIVTPNLVVSQQIQRDSLTAGEFVGGAQRISFGASMSSALFGFYPGFGPFSSLRHRLTPQVSYSYSPEVQQTDLQRTVFGESGGYAQNRVSIGVNQTWEAKLREPANETPNPTAAPGDSAAAGDTTAASRPAQPSEPQKVTVLSINSSPIEYDFVRAAREGNGFVTERVSNSISSDYFQGLNVQIEHELFDRSRLNPNDPAARGKLGTFAPRLSSLSTGFNLGPTSAIFRWLGLGQDEEETPAAQGVVPGTPSPTPSAAPGPTSFTGNPQAIGGGNWNASFHYTFSRQPRVFVPEGFELEDETVQTVDATMGFPLTPNWGVNWSTSFSITDGEFAGHRLSFKRNLHRWQANFNFFQTPTGNTAFEFFVSLIDNPDLKFDYRERNLGIDRQRRR